MCPITTVFLESRGIVDNIIYVPFTRFTHGIGQRNRLFINTSRLTVHISRIVVAVQNLNFIQTLQKDTTISSQLAFARDVFRNTPFNMQLEAIKLLLCLNISFFLINREDTVVYIPFGRSTFHTFPLGKVFSVKQNNSIRRSSKTTTFQFGTRSNNGRNRFIKLRHFMRDSCITGRHDKLLFLVLCLSTHTGSTGERCQHHSYSKFFSIHGK